MKELLYKIYNLGSTKVVRGKETKELINQHFIFNKEIYYNDKYRDLCSIVRYLYAELAWYFSGERTINNIKKYSKMWETLANNQNNVNSNYGYLNLYKKNRYHLTQFEWCLKSLLQDEFSRQAIMTYNDKDYYYHNNKDFICTQNQHFLIRDNKLITIVNIRSSDAIYGLSYDIPWWSIIQQQLFLHLKSKYKKLEIGSLNVNFNSVHIYENKYELVNNLIKSDTKQLKIKLLKIIPLNKSFDWYIKNIKKYIDIS